MATFPGLLIDEAETGASSAVYQTRFGSLLRAYQMIGFTPMRDYRYIEINRHLRRLHPDVLATLSPASSGPAERS